MSDVLNELRDTVILNSDAVVGRINTAILTAFKDVLNQRVLSLAQDTADPDPVRVSLSQARLDEVRLLKQLLAQITQTVYRAPSEPITKGD
jgi:hypothetical protein